MIQLPGRSQTLPSLCLPFFPLPLQTKEKNRNERALEEDEEKRRSMESRENGNPFFHCTVPAWCAARCCACWFLWFCTQVPQCSVALSGPLFITGTRVNHYWHVVNPVLSFPFTHFLLLFWYWVGLCLIWMRLGLNHILGKIRYPLETDMSVGQWYSFFSFHCEQLY